MKTTISNMIRVEDPDAAVREYAKTLRLPNPEYEKKQRMGRWTGRTPKEIRLYEQDGNALVFPFGLMKELWPMVRQGEWELDFRQDETVDYGDKLNEPLLDYQEKAVEEMLKAKYGILKSPAGSGKTVCGLEIIRRYGKKALWLCHTADLLKQSMTRAKQFLPCDPELFGTITEGRINISQGITFSTIQTMCNVDLDRYRHEWDIVIVDECHHVSQSAKTVTRYHKVLNNLAVRRRYGITATPVRADGLIKATFALLGPLQYEVPDEAVQKRVMKVGIKQVQTDAEITDDCLNDDGTLQYTGLIEHLTTDADRNKLIARTIMENKGHSCIILSSRIAHLEAIRNLLPYEMQEQSAIITGKMTSKKAKAEREEILDKMRSGELKYLGASYNLFKEGVDIPRLDRLFLATPEKFSSVIIQSVGRIARVFEGKTQPIVYDFVDTNIGYCNRAYKERCRHYRKLDATFLTAMDELASERR